MIVGLFVGGRGRRMGGVAKGLLPVDGVPIVERTTRIAESLGHRVVLVGRHEAYDAWRTERRIETLVDVGDIGPLGGLLSLLHAADHALAIACDMPFVTRELLERLVTHPPAPIVAAKSVYWEPFFARYDCRIVEPIATKLAASTTSLQALMTIAVELPMSLDERAALRDWDAPGDLP